MNCLAQRKKFKGKAPAWDDPNEQKLETLTQIVGEHSDSDDEDESADEDEDEFDMVAGDVRSKKIKLDGKELHYKHLTNINNDRSFSGGIKQVEFHPKSKVALVTTSRGQLDLFEIDGERNRYIQNLKLPYTQAPHCVFKPDGDSIVISAANYKGKFIVYNMISGEFKRHSLLSGRESRDISDFTIRGDYMACRQEGSSEVNVLSSRTYEKLLSLKLNEPARAIHLTDDKHIFVAGENARVYIWDLRKATACKHRFQDEGSVHATSLSITESSHQLSLGTDCGVVNTYELDTCLSQQYPTPIRTHANLKDQIDIIKYNHSGELMLLGSTKLSEGFRMVHSHSGTVYRNFPASNKRYGHLSSVSFSPLGGYMALGCSNGRAYLCRLPYYKAY